MLKSLLLFALVAGTWNLKWFPSGRAEHRASERVEAANICDAADVVRDALKPKNRGRVLFLQEIRDARICTNLVATIGDSSLHVAVATAFRDFRDNRLQWQQLAIVTDLPVLECGWKYAKRSSRRFIPRGYAYALLDGGEEGRIACYCIHLKSNYAATKQEVRNANAAKREAMVRQVISALGEIRADKVLIAGDFNADRYQPQFSGERIFSILEDEGFSDSWSGSQPSARGTHPGNTRYPDSTLDYVFHRGFARVRSCTLAPDVPVSDHRMVIVRF